ncbi:hypothetical protein GW17_00061432 [Ensete ventricosum]|nr:hypothetical protein GW17_00061432 [Ensete ventricosum]
MRRFNPLPAEEVHLTPLRWWVARSTKTLVTVRLVACQLLVEGSYSQHLVLTWGLSGQEWGFTPQLFRKRPRHVRASVVHRQSCSSLVKNLVRLTYMCKASLFASASFRSSVSSLVVDAYAKATVGGGVRCRPDSAPLTVKSAR